MDANERRVFPRYPFEIPLVILLTGQEIQGKTRDISKGGLGFTSTANLSRGDLLRLEISLLKKPYCFTGEIVVCRPLEGGNHFYGISFFDLSQEEAETIGMQYQQIEKMKIFITMRAESLNKSDKLTKLDSPRASSAPEQENQLRLQSAWTISLMQHLTRLQQEIGSGLVDSLIDKVVQELQRLQKDYGLQYKERLLHTPAGGTWSTMVDKIRKESQKLMLVDGAWYIFTGEKRQLILAIAGPLDASQYKVLTAYIQLVEFLFLQTEWIKDVKDFYVESKILYSQLASKLSDDSSVGELQEIFESKADTLFQFLE